MIKNFSFAIILLIAMFAVTGCGGGAEKPTGAADKTIAVWAEMQGIGKSDQDIAKVTGVPQAEIDKLYDTTKATLSQAFQTTYALNEENAAELADYWLDTLVANKIITTKLKEANDTNPVVELTFTPIDVAGVQEIIRSDNDLLQFMQMLEQIKADPATLNNALNDADFQNTTLQVIKTKIVDELPYEDAKTIDVKCQIVQGADGKTYWEPENPNAVADFLKQQ